MPHTKYTAPNGDTDWPSVTQVGDIVSKPGLYPFYAKHGMDGVKAILESTGTIGTEFHQGVHDRFSAKTEVYTTDAKDLVDAFFKEFVQPYKVAPVSLETKVVNLTERYHGTYDGIVHVTKMPYGRGIKGVYTGLVMADWKSSSGIYKAHGVQLGGYWGAESNPVLKVKHGLIVQVDRRTKKVNRKMFQELSHYYEEFLNLRRYWDYEHSKGKWAR